MLPQKLFHLKRKSTHKTSKSREDVKEEKSRKSLKIKVNFKGIVCMTKPRVTRRKQRETRLSKTRESTKEMY